uniref:Holin n=1 Tax=viral metagenome TaxID=1070528 RepID=A0A6M3XV00_9ZZZZ
MPNMAPKSMLKSWTVWGAAIAALGGILTYVGKALEAGAAINPLVLVPMIIAFVGLVLGIIGIRRLAETALTSIISKLLPRG